MTFDTVPYTTHIAVHSTVHVHVHMHMYLCNPFENHLGFIAWVQHKYYDESIPAIRTSKVEILMQRLIKSLSFYCIRRSLEGDAGMF